MGFTLAYLQTQFARLDNGTVIRDEGFAFGLAITALAPVPLPASALLLAAGLGCLGLGCLRRRDVVR
jgi:hypothetical protein